MSSELSEKITKILIAEDDDSMRRYLEVITKTSTCEVFLAKDGVEALELALQFDFDVIVTDAVMPNMTGYDLCRILRQTPEKMTIPLVILSGFDRHNGGDSETMLADFYLRKGDTLKDDLLAILKKIAKTDS